MNKLSWEEGNDRFKSGGAEWVSFTVPEEAFTVLLDTSETGALSSVLTATGELGRSCWIVRNSAVRTLLRRLTYPALDLHVLESLFMNKLFPVR